MTNKLSLVGIKIAGGIRSSVLFKVMRVRGINVGVRVGRFESLA